VGALAYLLSGTVVIGPSEVGVLQRWGAYRPPLLGPGLHIRWPSPCESVTKIEPDRVSVAGVGGSASAGATRRAIAWNAEHGARRDEARLFLTGDENLVELSGIVEYRLTREGTLDALFGAASAASTVQAEAESAFRDVVSHTPLEAILVSRRRAFET